MGQDDVSPRMEPSSYSSVDATSEENQRASVVALDVMAQIPAIRRLKAWALERLEVQAGMQALDVGCGTGEDTLALASVVGPSGRATGVDASEVMVAHARRRAEAVGSSAVFEVGTADALPLPDASVDVARCERVLQHVPDAHACVRDMHRALRPGGRLTLIDTDWRSLTFWPGDDTVTRGLRDAWTASGANPAAGSQLLDLLSLAGFTEPAMSAEVVVIRSRNAADQPPVTAMAANAVRRGTLSQQAVDEWLADVREAAGRGAFVATVTMTAVSGRRP